MKRVRITPDKMRFAWTREGRRKRVLSDWIVVRVKQGHERFAMRNVEKQGHKCIVPFIEEEGRPREYPLFRGYIFVLGPQWYYLQSTFGCLHPLMMGETPAFMPLKEMKQLLKLAGRDGVITLQREKFKKGQQVRIKKGAFQNFVGAYIRASDPQRVRVLLTMLGSPHELEFDRTEITGVLAEPAQPSAVR